MANLRCPDCSSDDVAVSIVVNDSGEPVEKETFAKCKKCGRTMTFEQVKAALGLK